MSQGCVLFITPWGTRYPYILMQFCMDDCRVCRSFSPSLIAVCEVLSPFFCKPCCHGFLFSGLDAEASVCASAILLVFSSTAGLFNFFSWLGSNLTVWLSVLFEVCLQPFCRSFGVLWVLNSYQLLCWLPMWSWRSQFGCSFQKHCWK